MKKIAFLSALFLAANAFAADADFVEVSDPFVRLAPASSQNTGAFMLLKNKGESPVFLVKAENAASAKTELHAHVNDNGVMKMAEVPEIEIPAKGEVALKPGSFHIMLMGLKAPLAENQAIAIALTFKDGSSQNISAPVKKQ